MDGSGIVHKSVTPAAEGSSSEVVEMKMPSLGQFSGAARRVERVDRAAMERVPFAFEKRIVAHLRGVRPSDFWNGCASLMWRAAISCLIITVITGAAVTFADSSQTDLFATDLERTVLAPVDVEDSW